MRLNGIPASGDGNRPNELVFTAVRGDAGHGDVPSIALVPQACVLPLCRLPGSLL
jgi:hypothetical protein